MIGQPQTQGPRMASVVLDEVGEDGPNAPATTPKPATQKQVDYLKVLGAPDSHIEGLDVEAASELIDTLRQRRQETEAATEQQRVYLKRLGVTQTQLACVKSKGDAARLIDELRIRPTAKQMAYLKDLGAADAELVNVRTKAAASALVERLKRRQ